MTAICGGGPSQPRPSTPEIVTVAMTSVESALILSGFEPVAAVLAPLMVAAPFETISFCQGDPPPDPGIVWTDVVDALNYSDPLLSIPAIRKLQQWFAGQYWYTLCECSQVATPAPPAPSNPGPGTGGQNTGLPGPPTAQTCWSANWQGSLGPGDTIYLPKLDLGQHLIPEGAGWHQNNYDTFSTEYWFGDITNFGMTAYDVQVVGDGPSGASDGYGAIAQYSNGTAGHVTGITYLASSGSQTWLNQPPPATGSGTLWFGVGAYNPDAIPHNVSITITFHCGHEVAPNNPCCPPDPLLTALLQQILGILQNLQLYNGPSTGWTPATKHTAIAGSGTLQLGKNVTGVRADFSSIPPDIRVTPGTPPFYWSLGFVTPLAIDVPLRSLRTVFSSQDLPLPPQATGISYTFPAGVVVDLTELLPTAG